jgi:hypothetical protein
LATSDSAFLPDVDFEFFFADAYFTLVPVVIFLFGFHFDESLEISFRFYAKWRHQQSFQFGFCTTRRSASSNIHILPFQSKRLQNVSRLFHFSELPILVARLSHFHRLVSICLLSSTGSRVVDPSKSLLLLIVRRSVEKETIDLKTHTLDS